MFNGIIGSIFILISAILYSTKYLAAAIVGANSTIWGKEEFLLYLSFTPNSLNICIYTFFIAGIILLIDYFKVQKNHFK